MISATDTSTTSRPIGFENSNASGVERRAADGGKLSDSEQRRVDELKQADTRVKRHEEAHKAAAGPLFRGGPNYTYETGPDGKRYAVAGSVQIDSSPGRTPEETVQKAQAIRRAALAPADPSSTDRAVAAKATRMEAAARQAIADENLRAASESPRAEPIESGSDSEPTEGGQATRSIEPVEAQPNGETSSRSSSSLQVMSPGDLGAEIWAIVSDLAKAESLRQDRLASNIPFAAANLDLLA